MLMVTGAKLTRMRNRERLPGQEQGQPESWYPVLPSDAQHGAIVHDPAGVLYCSDKTPNKLTFNICSVS